MVEPGRNTLCVVESHRLPTQGCKSVGQTSELHKERSLGGVGGGERGENVVDLTSKNRSIMLT